MHFTTVNKNSHNTDIIVIFNSDDTVTYKKHIVHTIHTKASAKLDMT